MPPSRSRPSRRQVLAASAVVPAGLLAGACTLSGEDRSSGLGDDASAQEDPDVAVLARAVIPVEGLVALLEQALSERAGLADVLEPLLANHRRHGEVLGAAGPSGDGGGRSTSTATRSPDRSPTESPALPPGREPLLIQLAEREQRAADTHIRHVRQATSGQFAALLAAISASESQHATVLREAAG